MLIVSRLFVVIHQHPSGLGKSDELILHKTFSLILKDTTKLLKIKKKTTNKQRQTKKKKKKRKQKQKPKLQAVVRDDPLDLTGLHKFRL